VGEVAQAVAVGETPERAFDRRWALTVIDRAIERLRAEAKASGRGALFAQVARFLSVEPEAGGYDAVAADLGMSRASVAMAVHRLRLRLREQVRAEIAQTLADPRQLETEMQELMACLRG
jgi:RNA polymerase sigma-70 factor (ECF subfamily)